MWVTVNDNGEPVKININFIAMIWPEAKCIMLQNGKELILSEKDYTTIIAETEGVEEELPTTVEPKKSELGDLLTKMHQLAGGRGEAKMTTDRKARLKTRLKDFTPEELILAATALGSDEFMQGANDNGKRYGTIDYLIRTSANINKWLEEGPKKKSMF